MSHLRCHSVLQAFQLWFCFLQLCSSWQDFSWHSTSCGLSAVAELFLATWSGVYACVEDTAALWIAAAVLGLVILASFIAIVILCVQRHRNARRHSITIELQLYEAENVNDNHYRGASTDSAHRSRDQSTNQSKVIFQVITENYNVTNAVTLGRLPEKHYAH